MEFKFSPVGTVICGGGKYPQEAPRQGVLAENHGILRLNPGCNLEQSLEDLAGFDRIWLIFVFDRVKSFRPKVMPPAGSGIKRGVLATRSPHRPNPIGISAVKLERIDRLDLHISEFDLLDGTPVLDIKPYIPMADSFPDARTGWLQTGKGAVRKVIFSAKAQDDIDFIKNNGGPDLKLVIRTQLGSRIPDRKRQRLSYGNDGTAVLAFRTWRIQWKDAGESVEIIRIFSGYSEADLADMNDDIYGDKEIHRTFKLCFPQ